MVDPDKDFDAISDAEIDPDSPITTGLVTKIRDALEHLEQWLGDGFVAVKNHDHDGVNSKQVVGTLSFEGVGSGSTHTLTNSSSDFFMINATATALDGNTPFEEILYKTDLTVDLAAFTMTGVANIIHEDETAGTLLLLPPVTISGTSLPDNTFVTIVSRVSSGGGLQLYQIRYNRSTEVLDFRIDIALPAVWTTALGMSLIEVIKG